jgi:signal transduction histidine kinase
MSIQGREPAGLEIQHFCHDLRQYVAAGLLLSRLPEEEGCLELEPRERLQQITYILEQLQELIATEVSDAQTKLTILDLGELVDGCVAVAQVNHRARIDTNTDTATPAFGDLVLLRRAVLNVIDNAARATEQHRAVTVTVGQAEAMSFVEVTDGGPGFGNSTPGSGYGMSIINSAVHACHGRLDISSGPGPGTTVRLSIPSEPEQGESS